MDLTLMLEMATGDEPDRTAISGGDGSQLTRAELDRHAHHAARLFAASGATQIGYFDTNGPSLPIALFGAALAHKPFVPFNYRLADDQLSELLHREPSIAVVASGERVDRLRALGVERIIDAGELTREGDDGDSDEWSALPGDPDDIAVLLYTSGTTSAPKAAVLRHRHLASYVISTVEFGSAGSDEAVLVSVPPYHIAGVSTILSNLYMGRRIAYLDPFEPHRWLETVGKEGITHAMVVPTMLARIVEAAQGTPPEVPTLRSLAYGGAPMPGPVIERALALFPDVAFTNAYGLTETSSTITVLGPDDHRAAFASDDPAVRARLGSAGRAVPGIELVVLDPDGTPLPPRTPGAVHVRGEQVSGEYVGSVATIEDGWFPTKDIGWLDEDGYLFIEGRSDDTIIRGGENIAPAEIEDVLLHHPAVAECAVVGVADEEWGQRIAAAVVLRPGHTATVDELREFTRGKLRGSKTPDVIEIQEELPYTDTGKLLRREVRQMFAEPTVDG
ncbi:MAG: AMP-binding protein [Acidimicrobiales bacterium]